MPRVLTRRARRFLAVVLAAALVFSGFPAPQAFAVNVRSDVHVVGLPFMGTGGAGSPGGFLRAQSPELFLPSLSPALPVATPASGMAPVVGLTAQPLPQKAASVAEMAEAVQEQTAILHNPNLGSEGSFTAGQRVEDRVTGRRSLVASGAAPAGVLASAPSAGVPASSLRPSVVRPRAGKGAPRAASAAAAAKPVDSRFSYGVKRRLLAGIAAVFGVVASLPVAGSRLAREILSEVARKRVVLSDYDDTLGKYNSVLAPEMVAAVIAVRKAGKEVVIITDRPEVKQDGNPQMTAFESLASIPAADRAGMYIAANSGGRVYRYDAQGVPKKIWEYPPLEGKYQALVREASDAVKSRLAELGTSQQSESWNVYGYALMLAVGTPEAIVKEVGRLFEAELHQRGMDVTVHARLSKDPANPPYVTFSVVNKSMPVKALAEILRIKPSDAVALGDSMYEPKSPEQPGRLIRTALRWAQRLSGRPVPLTGNETDRNMEKALPGMMVLSVGGTADPRMENAYVMPERGAAASLKVLRAMASHATR